MIRIPPLQTPSPLWSGAIEEQRLSLKVENKSQRAGLLLCCVVSHRTALKSGTPEVKLKIEQRLPTFLLRLQTLMLTFLFFWTYF